MNKTVYKILTIAVLPIVICVLVYLNFKSVTKNVKFEDEKNKREAVAVQRLKDIRELQVAFRSQNNRYVTTLDSLIEFYKSGTIFYEKQIGSMDDSIALLNTQAIEKAFKKQYPRLKKDEFKALLNEELLRRHENHEKVIVSAKLSVPVRDTLFKNRPGFCADSLAFVPFGGGRVEMLAKNEPDKTGYVFSLFQASMPYRSVLAGLDEQLLFNFIDGRRDSKKIVYPDGLRVGDIEKNNNNAGNWE